MRSFHPALLGLALLVPMFGYASAAGKAGPYPSTGSYEEIFAAMETARQQAIRENKLLLYAMGANWCHDSVNFVNKTRAPEFQSLLEQRYLVQLINVGNLEFIREVITRYGEPVIYDTPTVLVVEPVSDTLLNRDSLSYWRSAEAISMADTISYFSRFQPGDRPAPEPGYDPALAAALAKIDSFENRQAERIYLAYTDLGEMFRAGEADEPSEEFIARWENLSAMRGQITEDLANLRRSAMAQAGDGIDPIVLDFPHYQLFIDKP